MPRPKKRAPNRSDNRYEYKMTIGRDMDGKAIRKSFYSSISVEDAKEQAKQWEIESKAAEIVGVPLVAKEQNFGKWCDAWISSIKGTVKDSTYNLTYENSIKNHIKPYFGAANISDIKQIDIKNFFTKKGKERSTETLKKLYLCLNGIFESAVDNDLCLKNPCRKIKLKGKDSGITKQVYTEENAKLVMAFTEIHRFGLEIAMLLRFGLRRGELLGIRWDDIDTENRVLHIRRAVADVKNAKTGKMIVVVDAPKNEYSERSIPLPDDIIDSLMERDRLVLIGESPHRKKKGVQVVTDYVFYNSRADVCSPRTWSRRHYDVFMEDMRAYYLSQDPPVEVPILHAHELRHTRASLWVNASKNLFTIASVMGWGDLKMLRQRYAHADIESARSDLGL